MTYAPKPGAGSLLPALPAVATLTPEEHRALSAGRVTMHKWQNCAPGTWGGTVLDLVRRDLMSADWRDDPRKAHEPLSVYTVTRAGRDAYVSYRAPYVPITPPPTARG